MGRPSVCDGLWLRDFRQKNGARLHQEREKTFTPSFAQDNVEITNAT